MHSGELVTGFAKWEQFTPFFSKLPFFR